jgi:hypothetical protein
MGSGASPCLPPEIGSSFQQTLVTPSPITPLQTTVRRAGLSGLLLAVFQFSGLRDNFSLAFLHQKFLDNEASGLLIFIALFALGNLIQIPGWIFWREVSRLPAGPGATDCTELRVL